MAAKWTAHSVPLLCLVALSVAVDREARAELADLSSDLRFDLGVAIRAVLGDAVEHVGDQVADLAELGDAEAAGESLTKALDAAEAELKGMGYRVRMLFIDAGETAEAVVRQALERDTYDCIMIGAGVRVSPDHFLLFERLINLVHRHTAPTVTICFNTRPDDSVAAVLRWL